MSVSCRTPDSNTFARPRRKTAGGGPWPHLEGDRRPARGCTEIVRARERGGASHPRGRKGKISYWQHRTLHRPRSPAHRCHRAHESQARQGGMRRNHVVGALHQAQRASMHRPRPQRALNASAYRTGQARPNSLQRGPHVRRAIDQIVGRGESHGQFILTGSAVPADDITRHTGAGRISRLRLRPMTLLESGTSSGEISMQGLLHGRFNGCPDPGPPLQEIAVQICRGGWPGDLRRRDAACLTARVDYLEEIRRVDISRADGGRRWPVGRRYGA